MTAGSLAVPGALRAGAAGLHCAEAGAELLIRQRSWLSRGDFGSFVIVAPGAAGQAAAGWSAAPGGGALPCRSERPMLRLAAGIAGGIPAGLGEALTGPRIAAAASAVLHAGGRRGVTVTLPPDVPPVLVKRM